MNDPVLFDDSSAERIARAVKIVERQYGETAQNPLSRQSHDIMLVRITSDTADGDGFYPGVPTLYSAVDAAWTEYDPVKVKAGNGGALTLNVKYPAQPTGITVAGDDLWITIHGPVGAGALTVATTGFTLDGVIAYPGTSGIDTLYFYPGTGIEVQKVTSGGSPVANVGQVLLREASMTQIGTINIGTQTLKGDKTLNGSLTIGTITGGLSDGFFSVIQYWNGNVDSTRSVEGLSPLVAASDHRARHTLEVVHWYNTGVNSQSVGYFEIDCDWTGFDDGSERSTTFNFCTTSAGTGPLCSMHLRKDATPLAYFRISNGSLTIEIGIDATNTPYSTVGGTSTITGTYP